MCFLKIPLKLNRKIRFTRQLNVVFYNIGRIRDNVVGATKCLLDINVNKVESQLEDFLQKTHFCSRKNNTDNI
jgi:hypothetical protein